jgi:hypothetical protein
MYLFKAIMMCQECGEIHAEKWLESRNRHVSQTVIEMLCASCEENEFDIDPFGNEAYLEEDPFNRMWTPEDDYGIMVETDQDAPYTPRLAPEGAHCNTCALPWDDHDVLIGTYYDTDKFCKCNPFKAVQEDDTNE